MPLKTALDASLVARRQRGGKGKAVADGAHDAGVRHLVYGPARTGDMGTPIGCWGSKIQTKACVRAPGLRLSILRPMALTELMTDKVLAC